MPTFAVLAGLSPQGEAPVARTRTGMLLATFAALARMRVSPMPVAVIVPLTVIVAIRGFAVP